MKKAYNGDKFYNGHALMSTGSEWLACIGRRANGKSFWWLQEATIECLELGKQMAYVRRLENEIRKSTVNKYFEDTNYCNWLKKNYDYDGVIFDAGDLYFFKYDEKGKPVKHTKFGSCFAIAVARRYKGLHFDEIGNIILEEFITDSGYIEDEWRLFMSIISTIYRNKKGRVVLIGNTISRTCPYFREMGVDVNKLQMGEIVTIEHIQEDGNRVHMSIEFTPDIAAKSGLFFGKAEKNINKGSWETYEWPHLFFKFEEAEKIYNCFYIDGDLCFKLCICLYKDRKYLYVYPYDKEKLSINLRDDIFYREFTTKDNVFNGPYKKRHQKIWDYFERGKVMYADDLCGTELNSCLEHFNPFI